MLDRMRPYAGVLGAVASIVLAMAALVGLVYQVNISTRDDIRELRQEIHNVRLEVHDLRMEMGAVEERLTEEIRLTHEEIRLSQEEVLAILGNHHHADGSPPEFSIPPSGQSRVGTQ